MGFNLRNWLEESIADVNPFDNGATAQTVRANRAKAAPAQTVKTQTQNRPMFQQNNQPMFQQNNQPAFTQQKQFKIQTQSPTINVNNSMPKVQTFGQSSDPLKVGQVKSPQLVPAQPTTQKPLQYTAPTAQVSPNQPQIAKQLQTNVDKSQVSGISDATWAKMRPDVQQRLIASDKQAQQAKADVFNPLKIGGDVVKASLGVIPAAAKIGTDMIVDLGERTADFGEAGATVIGELNGQNKRNEEQIQRYFDEETRMRDSFVNRARAATTQAEFDKYVNMARSLNTGISDNTDRLNALRNEGLKNTDPMKTISNAGMTALDLATLGKGKAILEGTKLATKVSMPVVKQLARNTAITGIQGSGIGGAYGGLTTMKDPNATAEDYMKNIGTGALVGGGLGIGAQVALPVAGVAAKQAVKGTESAIVRSANYGLKPPTNLSKDELYIASKVRQAREGYISPQDITVQEAAIYQNVQRKLGAKPGTPDGEMAVVHALGAHRNFDTQRTLRKDATLNALEKSSDFTRQHLVPGGTLMGVKATGFKDAKAKGLVFDGVDGKPRFEVDDSGAKLKKDSFTNERLADALDHPELFRQYPALKDLRVVSQPQFRKTHNNASYDRGANAIAVNPDHMRTGNALKSTLLHEIQHAVQTNEQFARGGDLESAMGAILEARDKNRSELSEFFAKHRDKAGNVPEQHRERLRQLQSEQQRLMEIEAMARHTDGRYAYDRLAGEAEARAVQARMNMPMSERYVKAEPIGKDEVVLYHRTSKDGADKIRKSGKLLSKENTNEVFLSTVKDGQNSGYGDTIVPIRVKKSDIRLDDEFPSGEQHYAVKADKARVYDDSLKNTFDDSLDVPKEDLIVRNEGGKAMSVDPLESLKQEARKLDEQVRSYDMKKNFKGFSESDDARQLVELEGKLQKQNELVSRLENPVDKVTVSQIESVGRKAILKGDVTKEQLVKQYAKMSKEKYPSNQKRYIDDVYGSPEAYFDDVIAKGEAGIVEQYSQFAEMSTSPKFEDFYNRTVLSRNKTGLNRNEPKLNKVERKITETEPKRTEKATQSQPPKAKPSPLESLKQEARKYETAKEFALVHSNEKQRLRLDDLSAVETSDKSVDWGFDQRKAPPIIVDQHGQILDGHHRYYAAKEAFEKDAKLYNEGKVNHTYMEQKWGDVNFGEIDAVVKNKENLGKGWAQEKKSDNLTYDQLTDLYNQAHTEAKTAAPKVEAPKSAPIEKTPLTVYRGEPTKIAGRTFGGNTVIDNTTGLPRTTGGYTGIPTSTNGEYVNKRFGGSLSEVRAFEAKPTAKILSDPQEILRLSGAKSPDSFFNRKSGIAPYNGKKVYVEAKKAGYDAVDLSKIESMLPNKQTIESEVRILNQEAFIDKAKSGAPIEKTPQVGKPDPTAALKQEANQLKTPRGNLQDALQPDTAYSDMLRGIEAQTQQPQVFDPELKKLERQKQQIIDAEARAKYEASKQLAQDQKDLRKTIRASGGIGSSDYETLPSGLKRKNGRALDDLATELGFENDQALVDELTTHTQPERLKDLREVVEHEMKNGKSELSGDYKNLLKAIDDRHAELLRYPEGAKVVKNTQEFPSLDEFNSLLSTPEAQSNSNKTKQAVSAATADLRKQQFDAVVKGDLDTADQVRKKIGEIETGLKRTAPEVKREVETVQPVIKSIKDKAVREKFVAATKGYLGTKNSNKIERQVAIRDLENKYKLSEAEKLNAIQALDSSTVKPANDNVANYVKEFRSLTDSAYKQYRESGVNMGYQSSYLPRIYQNPETGQMYDSAEFELLQRGSKRMKGREADKVNTDWLVERDPTKLLERYYDSMDKVAAGQKYMKELQNAGLITASTEPVPGLRPIVAEGMQNESGMTYYAPKQVADKLNTMFGSKETTNLVEKVMEKGSGINSLFQGFVLSGGIPNTPVNSFGMMQVMKEAMTLHPVKAGRAIHAGFSKKFADKYFTSRKDMIKLMAENDVDIRIDLSETGKSGWQRTKEAWSDSKAKGLNRGWDEITNDSTFKRFMPMLEVVHFENMYKKAYKKTGDQAKAARIAADSVKNFYGKTGEYKQAVRSKLTNDAMGAALFAPRFRESMVNFWGKNIKALNPKNMTKLEYRDNVKFMAASAFTFAAMNALNEALNGVNMWDNPDDKKDKLIIPAEKLKQLGINTNGKDVGLPFLSSIATVPRNAISGAASFVTGDFESAGKRAKSFLSMPLSSAGDLIANEDYFGNRIVKDDVKGLDRFTQMGAYTAGRNMQPWLREGLNKFGTKLPDDLKKRLGVKEKGGFETAANALESPLRFYNPEYYKYGGKWAPRGDGVKFDSIAEQKAASQSQTNNTTGKSSRVKIADNLGSEYKKILTRYNDMSSEDREKLFFSENAAEYQYSLARYENDLAKGTLSVADKVVRKKSVAKAEVGSKFSKDTRESYDKLTKAELQNLTNNDPDGKRIWEDAVAYGDALVAAGIIKKNKLKTGSASGGSKKKGGSSRKGLVSNYKSSDTSAISKKLQQLAFGSSKSKSGSSAPKKHAAKLKGVRSA